MVGQTVEARVSRAVDPRRRRSAVVIEMAVVTPLLLMFMLGIIEFSWVFHVKQCLTTASRVGARTASLPGTTVQEIESDVHNLMTDMGLPQNRYPYTLTITRSTPDDLYETVELAIPYATISLAGSFFSWLHIPDLHSRTAFRRESQ